ncbi:lactosylceramide 4-alpha-galactosyltransferase-like [Drosophila albomicans]|uniref:Lactosylceramide 4-alpha-galactosyltransferase-like n=1 Tax=Drosophila albomicans TaxID=7291 RepID=A0A6P8W5T1_DROAB|nr:lactosylceramide 4-alpha-galactosyltransferase-like [Drosophila albomicans]
MTAHPKQLLVQLKKRWWIVLLLLIILLLVFAMNRNYRQHQNLTPKSAQCYLPEDYPRDDAIYRLRPLNALKDLLLEERQPRFRRTIFFLETSCSMPPRFKYNKLELAAMQACAIESAAQLNPSYDVFVLYASPWNYLPDKKTMSQLLEVTLSNPNVYLRSVNLQSLAVDTPVEDWLKSGELFKSRNPTEHISYLLRLLVLYRFGGFYVDFDVLFMRTLMNLPENFLGAESEHSLASSLLSLAPSGIGRQFIKECLRDFQQHFDAKNWRKNGDQLINRVASKFCGTQNVSAMLDNRSGCRGLQIHDWYAFYAVQRSYVQDFFDPARVKETLELTNGSYLVHLWNKLSYELPVKFNTDTAYGKLAKQYCPKVFEAISENSN